MPKAPPKRCSYPACKNKATHGARCDLHQHKPWSGNSESKRILKGDTLQKARKRLFEKQPLCAMCEANGIDRVGSIRDHIIPLAFGGLDVEENTQNLCPSCHAIKTRQESKRGRHK